MNWEQITNAISAFFDKPVVITIIGVLSGALTLFTIFAKTSLGKKAIKSLTALYNLGEQRAKQTLEKVQDVERLANERIEALKAEYEQKLAIVVSLFNFYIESLFEIARLIPNAKVQKLADQLEANYKAKVSEITKVIGEIYQDYSLAVEEKEKAIRKEYDEKIKFLEDQIKQINLYFNEIKEEPDDGQREEETNSDSREEEVQDNQ